MATLNLTDQSTLASAVQTRINQFRAAMELRKAIWKRLPTAKKRAWVTSGKDPIMTLAWKIYRYLRDNFFDEGTDNA